MVRKTRIRKRNYWLFSGIRWSHRTADPSIYPKMLNNRDKISTLSFWIEMSSKLMYTIWTMFRSIYSRFNRINTFFLPKRIDRNALTKLKSSGCRINASHLLFCFFQGHSCRWYACYNQCSIKQQIQSNIHTGLGLVYMLCESVYRVLLS